MVFLVLPLVLLCCSSGGDGLAVFKGQRTPRWVVMVRKEGERVAPADATPRPPAPGPPPRSITALTHSASLSLPGLSSFSSPRSRHITTPYMSSRGQAHQRLLTVR